MTSPAVLRCLVIAAAFAFFPLIAIASDDPRFHSLFQLAGDAERHADWDRASELYDQILKIDRRSKRARERSVFCQRRADQARRFRDLTFRKEILGLEYSQAVRLVAMIRDSLLDRSVRKDISPGELFRYGIAELRHALADPYFCEQFIPAERHRLVAQMREKLEHTWLSTKIENRQEFLRKSRDVAMMLREQLDLPCPVVLMELASGACNSLDEYSSYLTPLQFQELCQSLRGESVGVGISVTVGEGGVFVSDVTPSSPAALATPPLATNDRILSIDRKMLEGMMTEQDVRALLHGEPDSTVELEVLSSTMELRTVALRRRPVILSSVTYQRRGPELGYIRLSQFHEGTAPELDEAVHQLTKAGAKAMILDLRGNPGGLFESAIESARRFLSSGVIASTKHQDPKQTVVYAAKNPAAHAMPLVVLIDGDTASAAEVFAGALKENLRARVVGQTTFGKGCTQCVLKLPSATGAGASGGLRITVSRFFSPRGNPYTGVGVQPDLFIDRFGGMESSMADMVDPQLIAAQLEAERLLQAAR